MEFHEQVQARIDARIRQGEVPPPTIHDSTGSRPLDVYRLKESTQAVYDSPPLDGHLAYSLVGTMNDDQADAGKRYVFIIEHKGTLTRSWKREVHWTEDKLMEWVGDWETDEPDDLAPELDNPYVNVS